MEDLLTNKLVSHYNLPAPTTTNWFVRTEATYFEVDDTSTGDIVVNTNRGSGMAKFSNVDALSVNVVNYDKFITSIQDEAFKQGRKRCDILVTCHSNRYFILGELKDRNPRGRVRSGAIKQLLSSLQTLTTVPEINAYIDSKAVKRCCYFNKQSTSPTNLSATIAFNRLSRAFPDGFRMSKPEIESFGFDFYEYTGEQTMALSN